MSLALVVLFLCLVLVIANRAEASPGLRPALFALLGFINAGIITIFGVLPFGRLEPSAQTGIDPQTRINGLIVALAVAGIASAVMITSIRRRLVRLFPRLTATGGFDPDSLPHMIALLFCIYIVGYTIINYTLAGGFAGLAKTFQPPTVLDLLIQLATFLSVAFLGTGLFSRRTPAQIVTRLGLRLPTVGELCIGVITSFVLIGFMFLVSATWVTLSGAETVRQQSQLTDLISGSVTTLTFAMLTAGCAALGEEIAFRGALQPVFGLWPTAIIFALTHGQYTLTPAALVIVGVGLGLGWVRRRYNTTVAIVAHFLYDFLLLALPLYLHYLQVAQLRG